MYIYLRSKLFYLTKQSFLGMTFRILGVVNYYYMYYTVFLFLRIIPRLNADSHCSVLPGIRILQLFNLC